MKLQDITHLAPKLKFKANKQTSMQKLRPVAFIPVCHFLQGSFLHWNYLLHSFLKNCFKFQFFCFVSWQKFNVTSICRTGSCIELHVCQKQKQFHDHLNLKCLSWNISKVLKLIPSTLQTQVPVQIYQLYIFVSKLLFLTSHSSVSLKTFTGILSSSKKWVEWSVATTWIFGYCNNENKKYICLINL